MNNRDFQGRTAIVIDKSIVAVPDVWQMFEAFGIEPVDASPEDGYWCYEVKDESGLTLRLSFNVFENSLQTAMSLGGHAIATVCQEGAAWLRVEAVGGRKTLRGACEFQGAIAQVQIAFAPTVSVCWSTLVTDS